MKQAFILLAALLGLATSASAQWVTETYQLKPGWNGIWIPLDVSHATSLEQILPPEVTRVHMWTASKAGVLTPNPFSDPAPVSLQWEKWTRGNPAETTFSFMIPNAAYLIEVNSSGPITWQLKGKPEAPYYAWSSDGANLIGLPIRMDGPIGNRMATRVFELDPVLLDPGTTSAFHYNGGPMYDENGAVANPVQIPAAGEFPLNRFQAYWIKAGAYTDYYGPVNVNLGSGTGGLAYGTESSSIALRVRSAVKADIGNITVTLAPLNSESPPTGQEAITAPVPLRVRGTLNLSTGLYDTRPITAADPVTVTLAPGEEKELIFALDRTQVTGADTLLYASTLRITDSLGVSDIRIPVTARPTPKQGLWVGSAVVNRVDQIEPIAFSGSISDTANPAAGSNPAAGDILTVTNVDRGTLIPDLAISGQNVRDGTRILSQLTQAAGKPAGKEGTYQVSVVQRVSNPGNKTNLVMYRVTPQGTPDAMAMKLILHSSTDGTLRLLQRAVGGTVNDISAVGIDESAFPKDAGGVPAFRTSSAHFPAKLVQPGTGTLPLGPLSFTVTLGYNDPSHPFVHTYHPDHDNMDERFEQNLPAGRESNAITRAIVFTFVPNNPNGFDPQWGGTRLGGTYRETVTGLRSLPIVCSGAFVIDRVADAVQFRTTP